MNKINCQYQVVNNLHDGLWLELDQTKKYVLLTDHILNDLYTSLLEKIPNLITKIIVESGEEAKSLTTYEKVIDQLIINNVSRNDYLLCFGGGTITDLGGFVASTYHRGIKYINIPTTLIGQIDACIGGKTALNLMNHKNEIGTFYHPDLILIDPYFLNTLPTIEIQSGLGEMIKYGMIRNKTILDTLIYNHDLFTIKSLIPACLDIKCNLIKKDPYDTSLRQLLNYGHTIGHIIESHYGFNIKHGIAIAHGMLLETQNKAIFAFLKEILINIGIYDESIIKEMTKDNLSTLFLTEIMKDKKNTTDYYISIEFKKISKAITIDQSIGFAYIVKRGYHEYIWPKY